MSQRQEHGKGGKHGKWKGMNDVNGYHLNVENKYNDSYLVYTCV